MQHSLTIFQVTRLIFDVFGENITIHDDQYAIFNIIHHIQRLNSHTYGHVCVYPPHEDWIHNQLKRLNYDIYGHNIHQHIERVRNIYNFKILHKKK
jgi:hypothetical protein